MPRAMNFVRLTVTEQLKVDEATGACWGRSPRDSRPPYRNLKCFVETQGSKRATVEFNRSSIWFPLCIPRSSLPGITSAVGMTLTPYLVRSLVQRSSHVLLMKTRQYLVVYHA